MNDDWIYFNWPEWVPLEIRKQVERFWGKDNFGRGPKDWLENSRVRKGQPAFGDVVTLKQFNGESATGKYVHCWNNIGRVVHEDGSFSYVGFN